MGDEKFPILSLWTTRNRGDRTDHQPLVWLLKTKNPEGRLAKRTLNLQEYDYDVKYRPGKENRNGDALFRPPKVGAVSVRLEPSISREAIRKQQRTDPTIKRIIDNKAPKPYAIHNGLLVRKTKSTAQLVVPRDMQQIALEAMHDDSDMAGHHGIRRTYERLTRTYYWSTCYWATVEYCSTCEKCQKRKDPNPTQRAPMVSISVKRPFQKVAIDIVGPLKPTIHGNTHILTYMEYLTKRPEAIPLTDTKTETRRLLGH